MIENEVTVTYPATVTVSRNPDQDATFPRAARSWRLEAQVDGAAVLSPLTGQINQDGAEPGPLVVPTSAPFGGTTIVWSFVFLDDAGNQVGTGVSQAYPNNDPNNPASAVAIEITEIPSTISATTRFPRTPRPAGAARRRVRLVAADHRQRHARRQGHPGGGGRVGLHAHGAAGVVWEQGDEFYVRGVPTAGAGGAISLGQASGGGYARRPFLLLDAFAQSGKPGNHVLLEPDPSLDGYHVRPVTLDPVTAAPTWDSTRSAGTFELEVSAAALHSSGRVVAVNTDSGRLDRCRRSAAQTPPAFPPVATYTAGSVRRSAC